MTIMFSHPQGHSGSLLAHSLLFASCVAFGCVQAMIGGPGIRPGAMSAQGEMMRLDIGFGRLPGLLPILTYINRLHSVGAVYGKPVLPSIACMHLQYSLVPGWQHFASSGIRATMAAWVMCRRSESCARRWGSMIL
jgi:hypothetical protein